MTDLQSFDAIPRDTIGAHRIPFDRADVTLKFVIALLVGMTGITIVIVIVSWLAKMMVGFVELMPVVVLTYIVACIITSILLWSWRMAHHDHNQLREQHVEDKIAERVARQGRANAELSAQLPQLPATIESPLDNGALAQLGKKFEGFIKLEPSIGHSRPTWVSSGRLTITEYNLFVFIVQVMGEWKDRRQGQTGRKSDISISQ